MNEIYLAEEHVGRVMAEVLVEYEKRAVESRKQYGDNKTTNMFLNHQLFVVMTGASDSRAHDDFIDLAGRVDKALFALRSI